MCLFVEIVTLSVQKTPLVYEPWPCNPAAEAALLPLTWCSESLFSQGSSPPEECHPQRHRHQLSRDSNVVSMYQCKFSGFRY